MKAAWIPLLGLSLAFPAASVFAVQDSGVATARIAVFPDTSGSLEPSEFRAACEGVATVVGRLCYTGGIQELALFPWATPIDCQASPRWRATLPALQKAKLSEPSQTDAQRLLRRFGERRAQEVKRRQVEAQKRIVTEYVRAVDPALRDFQQQLSCVTQGKAVCTALGALLERCSQESPTTLAIVITDGIEECSDLSSRPLPAGARTVIVMVPSKASRQRGSPDLEVRCRRIRARAPWALIILSFRLSDSTIDWEQVLLGDGQAADQFVQPASAAGASEGLR